MLVITIQVIFSFIIKAFHANFRIVYLNLLLALALICFGFFISIIYMYTEDTLIPVGTNQKAFKIVEAIALYGCYMLRTVFCAFFIERSFATFMSKIYEKRHFYIVGIGATLLIHSFTVTLMVLWYSRNDVYGNALITSIIQQGFLIFLDMTSICCVFGLRRYNKRLEAASNKSRVELSERYQIAENIRSINAIAPISLICGIVNLIISITNITISMTKFEKYHSTIFTFMMNINVAIALTLVLKNSVFLRKVAELLPIIERFWKSIQDVPTTLKMALQLTSLKAEKGQDVHFEGLKQMWA
uniref:Gustatory receptor n=1 Tax=Panagrolaimus sp. ES5 TaxID=591445 RepID=A0AC34GY85_9BILA